MDIKQQHAQQDIVLLLKQAQQAKLQGKPGDARKLLDKALAIDANHPDALYLLGGVELDEGRSVPALSLIKRAIALRPDKAGYYYTQGHIYERLENYRTAQENYRKTIELDPSHVKALAGLGRMLDIEADYEGAESCLKQALELVPDSAYLCMQLANLYTKLDRMDDAAAYYRQATALDANATLAYWGLGFHALEMGDLEKATGYFYKHFECSRGKPWNRPSAFNDEAAKPKPPAQINRNQRTSLFKLQHDCDQLNYLMDQGKIDRSHEKIIDAYKEVMAAAPRNMPVDGILMFNDSLWQTVKVSYNQPIYLPDTPIFDGPVINPDIDTKAVEESYFDNHCVVYLDNLLTEQVLKALYHYNLEATVWYDIRKNYLGAYVDKGFCNPVLLQASEELRKTFPRIFEQHKLKQLWGYKYGPATDGINPHADFAAVNVNFWTTPDEGCTDPNSGGLEVFLAEAPKEWDFKKFNHDVKAINDFLDEHGRQSITIPHRQNRCVIFNSDLFHKTDEIHFKDSYAYRRVNTTMLFGFRES